MNHNLSKFIVSAVVAGFVTTQAVANEKVEVKKEHKSKTVHKGGKDGCKGKNGCKGEHKEEHTEKTTTEKTEETK